MILILLLSLSFNIQASNWSDLVIDRSTLTSTIELHGQPERQEITKLDVSELGKRLSTQHKEKVFTKLTYAGDKEIYKIRLYFLNDVLVMIDIEWKKRIPVASLTKLFPGAAFDQVGRFGIVSAHYPDRYSITGVTGDSIILADCASEKSGSDPGSVVRTRQVSRTLER